LGIKYSMNHLGIRTQDITGQFLRELKHTGCDMDIHINRTRFWLDPSLPHHVEFYLKWSHIIHTVHPDENVQTGLRF